MNFMKVLFVHDGPLRKDSESNYYGLAHNNNLFNRYKTIADEVGALIRVKEINPQEKHNFSRITINDFYVNEVPNFHSIKGVLFNKKNAELLIEDSIRKADYIVVRLHSVIGLQALKYARKYNKPYIIELVGCPWDAYWNHSLKGKIFAPYMYKKVKKEVLHGKYIIYVTNQFLQNRYPTRNNQVNCSNVSLKEVNEEILEKRLMKIANSSKRKKIIIGTTAALNVRYKGQQYIIEALGKMKLQGITHYEYQLVGGGDSGYLQSIAKKFGVEDQVIFLGALPHSEIFNWLDTIDIYAQPSRQEGLPRALIEAMSRGLPAIGAKTAGIPELLDEKTIFKNDKYYAEQIIKILKSFSKETMSTQAKANFKEAKNYRKNIIEKRRQRFFERFKEKEL